MNAKKLKEILSREYDGQFAYAFSYKLRNYIQHCGMPKLSFNIVQDINDPSQMKLSVQIDLDRDDLLHSYDGWTNVKPRLMELDRKICLLTILDDLMDSLVKILIDIKDLIGYEKAKAAKSFMLELVNEDNDYASQDYGICKKNGAFRRKIKYKNTDT